MINTTMCRIHSGHPCQPITSVRTPTKALKSLVLFEIGFGGTITKLTPTLIAIETHVMNCVDTTIFEGQIDDMRLLVKVAAIHLALQANHRGSIVTCAVNALDGLPESLRGHPGTLALMAPFLLGSSIAKIALLGSLHEEGLFLEEDVETLLNLSLGDLFAAVELSFDEHLPLVEVCEQTGAISS